MPGVLLLLIAAASAGPVEVPRDPGLYYLTPQGLVRIEGRPVTVERPRRKVPLSGKIPGAGGTPAHAEVLGAHASRLVTSTPVFYYRAQASEESIGAGDLAMVRLRSRGNHREFTISAEGDWSATSGIPLRAQVQFNSERVESGVFRLEPADDLDSGEYGLYLFRGRDLPGLLYDFAVPSSEKP